MSDSLPTEISARATLLDSAYSIRQFRAGSGQHRPGKAKCSPGRRCWLCGSTGNDLSSPNITAYALSVTQITASISGAVQDSGNANPDNNFRFDSTLGSTGGYIFNLSTKGLTKGTYTLNFTVTGDSFVYAAPFQVK